MESSKSIYDSGLNDPNLTSNVTEPMTSKEVDPFAEFANIGSTTQTNSTTLKNTVFEDFDSNFIFLKRDKRTSE
jgi:hypothetical protein